MTVNRDLGVSNVTKSVTNDTFEIPLEAPVARGEADILEQAKQIRARQANGTRAERTKVTAPPRQGSHI
jgi:hypothetical protein